MGLQVMGSALAVLGWRHPELRAAHVAGDGRFIGSNIVTWTIWEGLWMNCVVQSTGQMQCKVSLAAGAAAGPAGRALIVICIILAVFGVGFCCRWWAASAPTAWMMKAPRPRL